MRREAASRIRSRFLAACSFETRMSKVLNQRGLTIIMTIAIYINNYDRNQNGSGRALLAEKVMNRIKAKIALVTGASSGIGEATAERLAKAGYKVYGTSRRGAQAGKRSFEMLSLDVTSDDIRGSRRQRSDAARRPHRSAREQRRLRCCPRRSGRELDRSGPIDLRDELLRAGPDDARRRAAHATPGNGRIINIGSVLGFLPMPYGALYAATKHAVEGYSESLDHELRTRASGSRSSSPRTRRRRSTRTSWSRMPSSMSIARHVKA